MKPELQEIVKRLKESIERSGLSYVDLEKKTGIAKSSIQRYANGATKKIPIDAIQTIAKAVGVSAAYIMGWEDKEEADNQNDNNEDIAKVALFGGDKEVTDEMWDEVKDYIEYIKQKHFKE